MSLCIRLQKLQGKITLYFNLLNSGKWNVGWEWRETFCFYFMIKTCIPFIIKKILRKGKRKERGRKKGEGTSERWKAIKQSKIGREATISKVPFSPHKLTISVLATLQPKVPAPSSRHLADTTLSKSKVGTSLQHINLRFRSTDDSANLENERIVYLFSQSLLYVPIVFLFDRRELYEKPRNKYYGNQDQRENKMEPEGKWGGETLLCRMHAIVALCNCE